jgi:hypothetical protein
MIGEICAGVGIVALLLIIIYVLFLSKPFKYWKKTSKDKTSVIVEAKTNLAKVSVKTWDFTLERKRVRKGQIVEFDFAVSKRPVKLIVEVGSGRVETVEL